MQSGLLIAQDGTEASFCLVVISIHLAALAQVEFFLFATKLLLLAAKPVFFIVFCLLFLIG
jgi:hypothetical protein